MVDLVREFHNYEVATAYSDDDAEDWSEDEDDQKEEDEIY